MASDITSSDIFQRSIPSDDVIRLGRVVLRRLDVVRRNVAVQWTYGPPDHYGYTSPPQPCPCINFELLHRACPVDGWACLPFIVIVSQVAVLYPLYMHRLISLP